ncbi:hypothetical protein MP228_006073 [Amoeboaphelidium protococcarum]|nr:hypothetical protein MP228_006073 [Amoeboaphelidium protococcarum]
METMMTASLQQQKQQSSKSSSSSSKNYQYHKPLVGGEKYQTVIKCHHHLEQMVSIDIVSQLTQLVDLMENFGQQKLLVEQQHDNTFVDAEDGDVLQYARGFQCLLQIQDELAQIQLNNHISESHSLVVELAVLLLIAVHLQRVLSPHISESLLESVSPVDVQLWTNKLSKLLNQDTVSLSTKCNIILSMWLLNPDVNPLKLYLDSQLTHLSIQTVLKRSESILDSVDKLFSNSGGLVYKAAYQLSQQNVVEITQSRFKSVILSSISSTLLTDFNPTAHLSQQSASGTSSTDDVLREFIEQVVTELEQQSLHFESASLLIDYVSDNVSLASNNKFLQKIWDTVLNEKVHQQCIQMIQTQIGKYYEQLLGYITSTLQQFQQQVTNAFQDNRAIQDIRQCLFELHQSHWSDLQLLIKDQRLGGSDLQSHCDNSMQQCVKRFLEELKRQVDDMVKRDATMLGTLYFICRQVSQRDNALINREEFHLFCDHIVQQLCHIWSQKLLQNLLQFYTDTQFGTDLSISFTANGQGGQWEVMKDGAEVEQNVVTSPSPQMIAALDEYLSLDYMLEVTLPVYLDFCKAALQCIIQLIEKVDSLDLLECVWIQLYFDIMFCYKLFKGTLKGQESTTYFKQFIKHADSVKQKIDIVYVKSVNDRILQNVDAAVQKYILMFSPAFVLSSRKSSTSSGAARKSSNPSSQQKSLLQESFYSDMLLQPSSRFITIPSYLSLDQCIHDEKKRLAQEKQQQQQQKRMASAQKSEANSGQQQRVSSSQFDQKAFQFPQSIQTGLNRLGKFF